RLARGLGDPPAAARPRRHGAARRDGVAGAGACAGGLGRGGRGRDRHGAAFAGAAVARGAVPGRLHPRRRAGVAQRVAASSGRGDVEGPRALSTGAGPLVIARRQRAGGWPIAAVLAVVAVLLYMIRLALLPFVLGAIVGFVSDPLIRRLQARTGWRRGAVAAVLYLVLLLLIGGAGYGLGRVVYSDATQLVANGPGMVHRLLEEVLGKQGIELFGQRLTADALSGEIMGAARNALGFGIAAQFAAIVVEVVVGAFLTLVLIPYFM